MGLTEDFEEILKEKHSFSELFGEVCSALEDAYLEIEKYIDFCIPGETDDWKTLKESEQGDRIIRTIKEYFNTVDERIEHWKRIDSGVTRMGDRNAIEFWTERTNPNSVNTFNIRDEIDDRNTHLGAAITEEDEKEEIKSWCDNYLDSLDDLDTLMKNHINGTGIQRVWPFNGENEDSKRKIESWIGKEYKSS